MKNVIIEYWYKFCSETLYLHGLIDTIPELQITKVKKYKGKIVRKGDTFIKIRINDNSYDMFNHEDLIHTICHELAHMKCWNHEEEHAILTQDYVRLIHTAHRISNNYEESDNITEKALSIISNEEEEPKCIFICRESECNQTCKDCELFINCDSCTNQLMCEIY